MAGGSSNKGDEPGTVDIGEDDTCDALTALPVPTASRSRKTPVSRDTRPSLERERAEADEETDSPAPDTRRRAKQTLQRERRRG